MEPSPPSAKKEEKKRAEPRIDYATGEKLCSEWACGGKHYSRGFCRKHYNHLPDVYPSIIRKWREQKKRMKIKRHHDTYCDFHNQLPCTCGFDSIPSSK